MFITYYVPNHMTQDYGKRSTKDDVLDLIARTVSDHTKQFDRLTSTVDQHTSTLDRHSMTLDQHTAILNEHTIILNQHTTILDRHTVILDQHTLQLDRLTEVALRHEENIMWIKANMVTKNDMSEVYSTLDEILGLVKKNDQEITFMGEQMKRVRKDVDTMKPLVGVV